MTTSWDQVVAIMNTRIAENSPLIDAMIQVRDRYNGSWVVPWAENKSPGSESLPPMTPALIHDAIDHTAMQAGSVSPAFYVPSVKPGEQEGRGSREWANRRRKALGYVHAQSRTKLVLRRWFRHLAGYGMGVISVEYDFKNQHPRVVLRDPLSTYPDPKTAEDYTPLENCGFVYGKSAAWIRATYPEMQEERGGPIPAKRHGFEELWDLIEWWDEDEMVLGVLGPRVPSWASEGQRLGFDKEIARYPNMMGKVPVVTGARVTLDRIISQLQHVVGMVDLGAKLQYLDIMATEKSIFPDTYLVGANNGKPEIASHMGQWQDGRTGRINLLRNVAEVGQLRHTPDPTNKQTIDRIERNARVTGGMVPQFQGESYGALRTGRGIDSLMGAAVDPRVQELHEITETALPLVNDLVFSAWEKSPDKDKTYHVYSGWAGDRGETSFMPSRELQESHFTAAAYPIPGAGAQETNIILTQMFSAGINSMAGTRRRHPWIEDDLDVQREIDEESTEAAIRAAILQQVQSGQLPIVMAAEIESQVRDSDNHDYIEAIMEADRIFRERQAQEAPPVAPEAAAAGQLGPAEAQLGLAAGPEGVAQAAPPEAQIGPTAEMEGMRELMNTMAASNRNVGGV